MGQGADTPQGRVTKGAFEEEITLSIYEQLAVSIDAVTTDPHDLTSLLFVLGDLRTQCLNALNLSPGNWELQISVMQCDEHLSRRMVHAFLEVVYE